MEITTLLQENNYKQLDIFTTDNEWHALFNKKGQATIKEKGTSTMTKTSLDHNRKKQYILEDGKPIPFFVALGIMTPDGKVVKKRYDKFKQINRFIEMVDDVIDALPTDKVLNIIDFGCGRSYLTFALYHYLVSIKHRQVHIHGLDLKEKVINDCNQLAKSCGYNDLTFEHGDIAHYTSKDEIDMVVTLHACDTATDFALQKATQWQAKVILSVPCCQHELNQQIDIVPLRDILQYGIIKERMSALITDAIRANWLKLQGYDVQILEFIDIAHTPKNLLIRAIKIREVTPTKIDYSAFNQLQALLNADLTINK
jgi:SAM-dependent methyltransferase